MKSGCDGALDGSKTGDSGLAKESEGERYRSVELRIIERRIRSRVQNHRQYQFLNNVLSRPTCQQFLLTIDGTFVALPRDERTKTFWWSICVSCSSLFGVITAAIVTILLCAGEKFVVYGCDWNWSTIRHARNLIEGGISDHKGKTHIHSNSGKLSWISVNPPLPTEIWDTGGDIEWTWGCRVPRINMHGRRAIGRTGWMNPSDGYLLLHPTRNWLICIKINSEIASQSLLSQLPQRGRFLGRSKFIVSGFVLRTDQIWTLDTY